MSETEVSHQQLETYSTSKCRKLNWINCPIDSWIFQVQSIPFLYGWGNPGDVITPRGCVKVTSHSENEITCRLCLFKIIDQFHKFLTWNLWYNNLKWKLEHIITLSKIILKKSMWGDGRHLCAGKPLFAFLWVYS